jgi:hypothetical protein
MSVVNAIILVGNNIRAAVVGAEAQGADALNKTIDSLRGLMLPQYAEESERRARKAREMLMKEVTRGPLQIKVLKSGGKRRKQ